jgi:hypothetical protein
MMAEGSFAKKNFVYLQLLIFLVDTGPGFFESGTQRSQMMLCLSNSTLGEINIDVANGREYQQHLMVSFRRGFLFQ